MLKKNWKTAKILFDPELITADYIQYKNSLSMNMIWSLNEYMNATWTQHEHNMNMNALCSNIYLIIIRSIKFVKNNAAERVYKEQ